MILIVIRHQRKHNYVLSSLNDIEPEIGKALVEVTKFFNYRHYITESERIYLVEKYDSLYNNTNKVINTKEFLKSEKKDSILRFNKAISGTEEFKKKNNDNFIKNQLKENKEFFDTVLAFPLDQQQKEAIVSLEDNVLVISSAGSGKTMTIVGKARYLIEKQGIDPSKILLVTFTKKAAESLSVRLMDKKLNCVTFHKFALDIIGEVTGKKPTLTASDFSLQVYQDLLDNDKSFRHSIVDFILSSRYKMKDQFEYDSLHEYIRDRKIYGVKAYYTDMDGHTVFCKSDEECQICDYLGRRGLRFRYEEKYEFQTADKNHRQYSPDFSIYFKDEDNKEHRAYLEHFSVNEYGRCPKWYGYNEECAYLQEIEWKRQLHHENGTILIETSSADFHKGDVFEKLEKQLKLCGIKWNDENNNDISRDIEKQEQSILDMLTSFNFLMKSRAITIDDIQKQNILGKDRMTINRIIIPFIAAYEKSENSQNEIDFTDAIIKATALCNEGNKPEYDYILVDEFQDISMERYRFLQSLRKTNPLTKLFCVGDDWQSIYRFAGSDMALFKSFSKYFGYTKECRMETTYRFGEPLIGKSSKFILTNPEQKEKTVHSFSPENLTNIDFIPTCGKTDISEKIRVLIDEISSCSNIYFLGRYSFDVNILKDSVFTVRGNNGKASISYNGREFIFMTIHQSKGLESDYVILLNCNSGALGFPSDIADNPVLKYVLSEPDGYAFGEERRVFYVGITRAKKHTYVLYEQDKPSPFIGEFMSGISSAEQAESVSESELCPKCHCGRVEVVYKGVAVNGNPYFVLGCSNHKYGCDYRDVKFVNINKQQKIRKTR